MPGHGADDAGRPREVGCDPEVVGGAGLNPTCIPSNACGGHRLPGGGWWL